MPVKVVLRLRSFIISILASINIPSNQQSGESIRENPKKAFLINNCTNMRMQLRRGDFVARSSTPEEAVYRIGQEEVVPLTSFSPAFNFCGHQGRGVPSIRQRWVYT